MLKFVSIWACSCTRVVLIHELIKIPNYARVFHNNKSTPTDISKLLTTLSSLGISISTILCYSSYFGLTKSNYFCFSLAFGISFHYQFWWMDLGYLAREAGIIVTPKSLLMYLFSWDICLLGFCLGCICPVAFVLLQYLFN